MKKLILTAIAVTCAVSVFAQGTVVFNNRISSSILQTHVYAPLATATGFSQIGNGATDFPVGGTSWAGFSAIGATLAGQYGGNATFTQLLGGTQGAAESALAPSLPVGTFRTGAAAGYSQGGMTSTLMNVPPDGNATIEMVAWDNSSGLYSTWTQAYVAWTKGWIAAGRSNPFNIVTGGTATPNNMIGLQSFNLYIIPEPSTFALAGLGLASLLVLRRRK